MNSRDNYIPLSDCIDGNIYVLKSRNLTSGIFIKEENGFIGIREKFGHLYLATEYHYDTGAPFGTAKPLSDKKSAGLGTLPANLGFRGEKSDETLYKNVFKFLEVFELLEGKGKD